MAKARKRKAKARKNKTATKKRRTKRAARKSARTTAKKRAKRRGGAVRRKTSARKVSARKTSRRKTGRATPAAKRKTKRKAARGVGSRRSAATPTRADELRRADMPDPDKPAEAADDLHKPDPLHSEDGGVAQHPIHDSDTEDLRSADYERMIDERARGGFDTSDKYEIERKAGRKMRKSGEG